MNADQDNVSLAKCGAAGVYAAYALFERDVSFLQNAFHTVMALKALRGIQACQV